MGALAQRRAAGATSRALVPQIVLKGRRHMSHRAATIAIAFVVCTTSAAAIFAQSPTNPSALTRSRYLPQYTASGELILPKNSVWRECVFVGEPLPPTRSMA